MKLDDIKNITVIGAGQIGQAAALEFALGGYEVSLHSRSEQSLRRGIAGIRDMMDRMIALGLLNEAHAVRGLSGIACKLTLGDAVANAQIVYEAVYEDLDLKRQLFSDIARLGQSGAILVSGTSTLSLSDIASATPNPGRVLLANSSNPPYLVPLVEVMRNECSDDEAVDIFCAVLTRIGKKPVVIRKEVPGFVANRLQVSLLREALHLVQEGVVNARDIDMIIRSSIGRRWAVAGIFEVFEISGQDLTLWASSYLMPHLSTANQPQPILHELVERGELGIKTGKGFYDWTPKAAEALQQRIARALVEIERWDREESTTGAAGA